MLEQGEDIRLAREWRVRKMDLEKMNQSDGAMKQVVESIKRQGQLNTFGDMDSSLGKDIEEAFENLDILLRVPDLKKLDLSGCGFTWNDFVEYVEEEHEKDRNFAWVLKQSEIDAMSQDGKGDNERGLRTLIIDVRISASGKAKQKSKDKGDQRGSNDDSEFHTVEIGPCEAAPRGVIDVWRLFKNTGHTR